MPPRARSTLLDVFLEKHVRFMCFGGEVFEQPLPSVIVHSKVIKEMLKGQDVTHDLHINCTDIAFADVRDAFFLCEHFAEHLTGAKFTAGVARFSDMYELSILPLMLQSTNLHPTFDKIKAIDSIRPEDPSWASSSVLHSIVVPLFRADAVFTSDMDPATHAFSGPLLTRVLQYMKDSVAIEQDQGGRYGAQTKVIRLAECKLAHLGAAPTLPDGVRNLVLSFFKSKGESLGPGCTINEAADALAGYNISAQRVREAVEFLTNEGHIYSTIDDDHFKAT